MLNVASLSSLSVLIHLIAINIYGRLLPVDEISSVSSSLLYIKLIILWTHERYRCKMMQMCHSFHRHLPVRKLSNNNNSVLDYI